MKALILVSGPPGSSKHEFVRFAQLFLASGNKRVAVFNMRDEIRRQAQHVLDAIGVKLPTADDPLYSETYVEDRTAGEIVNAYANDARTTSGKLVFAQRLIAKIDETACDYCIVSHVTKRAEVKAFLQYYPGIVHRVYVTSAESYARALSSKNDAAVCELRNHLGFHDFTSVGNDTRNAMEVHMWMCGAGLRAHDDWLSDYAYLKAQLVQSYK
jgi:hypothetical protein